MSRAFTPPDTLSNEDIKKIADVRREIWTNGFKGLAIGSSLGFSIHQALKIAQSKGLAGMGGGSGGKAAPPLALSRNTLFLSVLGGGALGSFVLATTAGKNNVHNLHDVFEVGKREKPKSVKKSSDDPGYNTQGLSFYQQLMNRDHYQHEKRLEHDHLVKEQEQRRLVRRQTLSDRLQGEGQSGISDSHGGHWVEKEENILKEEREHRRSFRRQTLTNRLQGEGQSGISDSHGGHWVEK